MKRQMIAAVLGMVMVMGSTGMAMADTPANNGVEATMIKASVCTPAGSVDGEDGRTPMNVSIAVRIDGTGEAAEGLPVCRVGEITSDEGGVRTMPVVSGVLDKEAFTKVLTALDTDEKEQTELLEAYDAYVAVQEDIDQLYAGLAEADEAEQKRLIDEGAKLQEKQVNPVTDEMIEKALELGLLEEHEISLSDAVSVEPAAVIPAEKIEK